MPSSASNFPRLAASPLVSLSSSDSSSSLSSSLSCGTEVCVYTAKKQRQSVSPQLCISSLSRMGMAMVRQKAYSPLQSNVVSMFHL
jgi:hypothetical protein